MLWFSAPSRLNQTFEGEGKNIVKYHEVGNMAITETITLPVGGLHTPRTCMLRSVAAVLYRSQNEDSVVDKEMRGWGMKGSLVLLPKRSHCQK